MKYPTSAALENQKQRNVLYAMILKLLNICQTVRHISFYLDSSQLKEETNAIEYWNEFIMKVVQSMKILQIIEICVHIHNNFDDYDSTLSTIEKLYKTIYSLTKDVYI